MVTEYAVLDGNGTCVNRVLWDGESSWQPPDGCTVVADPDGVYQVPTPEPDPAPDLEVLLSELTPDQKTALHALLEAMGV
ncbi:MAG: hypothetical protein ACO29V_02840 [Limnohabitans sp.]